MAEPEGLVSQLGLFESSGPFVLERRSAVKTPLSHILAESSNCKYLLPAATGLPIGAIDLLPGSRVDSAVIPASGCLNMTLSAG
jgi:hypothetical protein